MEYLLEVEWTDAVASSIASILSTLPREVEQATSYVPPTMGRGFVVVSSTDRTALDEVARAVAAAGAGVRIIPAHER